ncbi:hypothetical protein NEHOM01_1088 [Nematocida homosporus]|uniref:uncharacterized protein n=1 Tax=Nematocida homosporus TaxID=1912981 RepID=UPI00221EC94C|nr:uncharacterized protein NEHOM01_1088 [Nematocida homosporus]KAI5185811.1 hypothetical protein NEHOM01_1088 [Nematocida homosporus]
MLWVPALKTKKRETSDMEDLEVLGSIAFDLQINKEDRIKKAFVSLVDKLGTPEFLPEYSELYQYILTLAKVKEQADLLWPGSLIEEIYPALSSSCPFQDTSDTPLAFTEIATTNVHHKTSELDSTPHLV